MIYLLFCMACTSDGKTEVEVTITQDSQPEDSQPEEDSIGQVVISPIPAFTDTVLQAILTSDSPMEPSFIWFVDNQQVQTAQGDYLDGAVHFSKHQTVRVSVMLEQEVVSEPLIVSNSLPTAPQISFARPETGDLLCQIDVHSTDADGDLIDYRYGWQCDGSDTADVTSQIESSRVDECQSWTCTITPSDAEESGDSATVTIDFENCDADEDGYDSLQCGGTDCDDGSADVNPDVAEKCDGIDNDCDGVIDGAAISEDFNSTIDPTLTLRGDAAHYQSNGNLSLTAALPNSHGSLFLTDDIAADHWFSSFSLRLQR